MKEQIKELVEQIVQNSTEEKAISVLREVRAILDIQIKDLEDAILEDLHGSFEEDNFNPLDKGEWQ